MSKASEKTFRIGSVLASVFVSQVHGDGGKRTSSNVNLQRCYGGGGEWSQQLVTGGTWRSIVQDVRWRFRQTVSCSNVTQSRSWISVACEILQINDVGTTLSCGRQGCHSQ